MLIASAASGVFVWTKMLVVGLSGGVATGKSSVSSIFRQHGVPVIDADLIARKVVQPGTATYAKLRVAFGDEFFDDTRGGNLRREKLGRVVFGDVEKRRKLNAITHPAIRWEMFKQFLTLFFTGTRYIVFDTPLLFESGFDKWLSTTIVVWCDGDKELQRLIARDDLPSEDAKARIAAQLDIEEKKKRAKFVLDNNGNRDELREQVEKVIKQLDASWWPLFLRIAIAVFVAIGSSWALKMLRRMY